MMVFDGYENHQLQINTWKIIDKPSNIIWYIKNIVVVMG